MSVDAVRECRQHEEMLRSWLTVALLVLCACEREAPSKPASASASASPSALKLTPTLSAAELKPLARYDGDFASSIHDGWFSRFENQDVHIVFSRQRTLCTLRPGDPAAVLSGPQALPATCTGLAPGLTLRDDRLVTDAPERVTFIDGDGAPGSHWLVVNPSPAYLVAGSGALVADDVVTAFTWADGAVSYATRPKGEMMVHRTGSPKASARLEHGNTDSEMAAGYVWTRTLEQGTTYVSTQRLAHTGPPLGPPTRHGPIPGSPASGGLGGCRSGDTTWVVVTTLREGTFSGARAYGVFRVRDGAVSSMLTVEARGLPSTTACTADTLHLVERATSTGKDASVVRCSATACAATALPERLLQRIGTHLAPMGDRLLALWSEGNDLSAWLDEPDRIFFDSAHVIVDGVSPSIHAVIVRGEEAIVVFSVGVDMHAVAVSTSGRVRPIVRR